MDGDLLGDGVTGALVGDLEGDLVGVLCKRHSRTDEPKTQDCWIS